MIILETDRLVLRNWTDADAVFFHEINSDPEVMAFYPFRRSRDEADILRQHLTTMIADTGLGFYCMVERASGEPVGFCGIAEARLEPLQPEGSIEIGWRLARRHWGKGYVTEAAKALLDHGFSHHGLDRIISFAVHDNHRSTAVMERIGMSLVPGGAFDHPKIPQSHPQLNPHVLYEITLRNWWAGKRAG